jgi:hypothetical protein
MHAGKQEFAFSFADDRFEFVGIRKDAEARSEVGH